MSSGRQTSLESAICGEECTISLCSHAQLFMMPLPESEAFNITFVQAVETYNCLYDITSPDYNSKDEQDKAWNNVAHKFCSYSCLATTKTLWTPTFYFRYGYIQHLLLLRLLRRLHHWSEQLYQPHSTMMPSGHTPHVPLVWKYCVACNLPRATCPLPHATCHFGMKAALQKRIQNHWPKRNVLICNFGIRIYFHFLW